MDNYGKLWKVWKETAFVKLCSFLIDLLAFELGKLCPGVGIFSSSFFRPGGRNFALKSCTGGGDFEEKISCPGISPWGLMVTGQIDTCITFASQTISFVSESSAMDKKVTPQGCI